MVQSRTCIGRVIVSMAALLGGCGSRELPLQPVSSSVQVEPAPLQLGDLSLRALPPISEDTQVLPIAFPWSAKPKQAPPAFAQTPVQAPVVELPMQQQTEGPLLSLQPSVHEAQPIQPFLADPALSEPLTQPLPTAEPTLKVTSRPAPITAAMERAEGMTRQGLALAQRGAIFSARAEFLRALRTLATARDELQGNTHCTRCLTTGLKALEEARDFDVRHAGSTDTIDVSTLVAGHRTSVLKAEVNTISPFAARLRYQTFACEQLSSAAGNEVGASMAMYGLGRIASAATKGTAPEASLAGHDARVWYQTALMVDGNNYRAAHELGSLYAQQGEWQPARDLLQRSVSIVPQAATWTNLAIVHQKLGEPQLAEAAKARAIAATNPNAARGVLPPIQWVDADNFAKSTGPNEAFFPQTARQTQPATKSAAAPSAAAREPRSANKTATSPSWRPFGMPQRR